MYLLNPTLLVLQSQRLFPRGQSQESRRQWCTPSVSHPGTEHQAGLTALTRTVSEILSLNLLSPAFMRTRCQSFWTYSHVLMTEENWTGFWVPGSGFAPNALRPSLVDSSLGLSLPACKRRLAQARSDVPSRLARFDFQDASYTRGMAAATSFGSKVNLTPALELDTGRFRATRTSWLEMGGSWAQTVNSSPKRSDPTGPTGEQGGHGDTNTRSPFAATTQSVLLLGP